MSGPWEKFQAQATQDGPWTKYAKTAVEPESEESFSSSAKRVAGNIAAGAVRGAGSIGATILAPIDATARAVGMENDFIGRTDRREAMDAGLRELGADTDSIAFKGGKLGAEVAGTAGAGGLIAKGLKAIPAVANAAPRVISAIESGGFVTGAPAAAGIAGKAADLGIRAIGGGVTGAASAGAIDPELAGGGAVIGAALPGIVKVGGVVGEKAASAVETGAKKLMQSAIKPTINQLKTGEAETAVQTLLDYGISPTKAGVNKIREIINSKNDEIASLIGASNATVDKQAVVNRLGDVINRFSNQVSPTADLAAIRGVADDFLAHPVYNGATIPVQAAQELKQGTYRTLSKKYGQIGSAETEAQKGLARGLKEEVAQAVPGVQALNAEESRLLATLDVAERRALMEVNKNPMGLAALAGNPLSWAAFMADRSAAFKAMAARMLNRTAEAAQPVGRAIEAAAPNPLLRNSAVITASGG